MRYELSTIDSDRFGIPVATARVESTAELGAFRTALEDGAAQLVVVRTPASGVGVAQALEELGARLTDTIVTFARELAPDDEFAPDPRVRVATTDDVPAIERIARTCYTGYQGHYHVDDRLPNDACDDAYVDWAGACCDPSRGVADEMFVADVDGEVAGFFSVVQHGSTTQGVLSGVHPSAGRQGLYHALLTAALRWSVERGATTKLAPTQLWNQAVQRAWVRLGFLPRDAEYTFHLWTA